MKVPFPQIAGVKIIHYFDIYLTERVEDPINIQDLQRCKNFLKELKEVLNKWKDILGSWIRRIQNISTLPK